MDVRGRLAGTAERETTNLAAVPDGVLHRTTLDAPDRVVLHIQVVGLFQVLPVHETGAPINRRVTALALHLRVMLDVMGRVMLGRRRDGFDVVEDALDRDVRDYAPFEVAPVGIGQKIPTFLDLLTTQTLGAQLNHQALFDAQAGVPRRVQDRALARVVPLRPVISQIHNLSLIHI